LNISFIVKVLQSLLVKLETTNEDKALLLQTMKHYNLAANYVAEQAFKLKLAKKYELQKILYQEIREKFNLSAQFAIRVIN